MSRFLRRVKRARDRRFGTTISLNDEEKELLKRVADQRREVSVSRLVVNLAREAEARKR